MFYVNKSFHDAPHINLDLRYKHFCREYSRVKYVFLDFKINICDIHFQSTNRLFFNEGLTQHCLNLY